MSPFITVIIGGVVLLGFLIHLKRKKARDFWKKLGVEEIFPPGIIEFFWKGTMTLAELDVVVYNQMKGKKFGGFYEILMWNPVVYIRDLDLMKHVYIKDFDHFPDRRGFDVKKTDPHFNNLLINQKGDDWKGLRSKMSPTFTTGKIRRMFQIFDASCKKLVKAINKEAIGKEEVDIRDFHGKVTMDIIASAAFGIQTDMFEEPDSVFAKMGAKIQNQLAGKNFAKIFFVILAPKLAELFKIKITDSEADTFFSKVITETLDHRAKTGEKRDDFLQLMLEARQGVIKQEDESLLDEHEKSARLENTSTAKSKIDFNDDLIIAQCLLFILGGFDTVESLLVWAVYSLALNPDIQEKLHGEVKESFESHEDMFTYDSISAMEYMDRFIHETLRMYPPSVRLERRSVKPYKIPGTEIVIPKDTLFQLPVYGMHHDPELWPEPSKFDPDRFLKENVAKRHACAYVPFGLGPRNCIGNRFAMTECKLILVYLVLNFKFSPSGQTVTPPKFATGGTLKPEGGMWLNISSRVEV